MKLLPIPELDGYRATDDGRIQSPTGKWLALHDNGNGYLYFGIQRRFGPNRQRAAHIAICSAFHGPKPFEGAEVRHLDGNKRNLSPSNLAWGTRVDNRKDSLGVGHPAPRGKLNRAQVEEILAIVAAGPKTPREISIGHVNYSEIARRFGVTSTHIRLIVNGDTWEWRE
jgi:hypothetical protein